MRSEKEKLYKFFQLMKNRKVMKKRELESPIMSMKIQIKKTMKVLVKRKIRVLMLNKMKALGKRARI